MQSAFLVVGPRALHAGCPQMARGFTTVDCARVMARSLPNWFPGTRGLHTRQISAAG